MKQRDISTFFGKAGGDKPAAAGIKSTDRHPSTKENKDPPAPKRPSVAAAAADDQGGRRLKRLRRNEKAGADAAAQQEAAPELQDDELGDAPGAITAVAAAAGSSEKTASAAAPQGDSSTAVLHNSHADRPAAAAPGAEAAAAGVAESAEPQQSAAAAVVPKSANKASKGEAATAFSKLLSGSSSSSGKSKPAAAATGRGKGSASKASLTAAGTGAEAGAAAGAGAEAGAAAGKQDPAAAAISTKQQQQDKGHAANNDQQQQQQPQEQHPQLQEKQKEDTDTGGQPDEVVDEVNDVVKAAEREAAEEAAADDKQLASRAAKAARATQQKQDAFKAAFKQAPSSKKASKAGDAAAAAAGKVEGVGSGAVAAAKQAVGADIQSLVNWPAGASVPYAFLAETFQRIAATSKRLEIISLLTAAFRAILASTPGDLLPAVYLCTNRVAPAHEGLELGVGDAILIKALAQATGRKESSIKADYEAEGDLGSVAAACRGAQRTMFKPQPLTIAAVLKTFKEIAQSSGQASQERKRGLITKLVVASKDCEPGYIVRSLQAKLRIGLAEQSVLVALAHAALLHKEGTCDKDGRLAERLEQAAQGVKAAYSECPSYDALVPALLEHPLSELSRHVHFIPGVPVRPMLAKATTGVGEVLDKFSGTEFTCEYKYDGERVQLHVLDGGKTVHIYSRNAEDMTPRYPDIVSRLPSWLAPGTKSIVIDGEAVAWDPDKGRILPFQVLSTRARKEVALADVKVQVCVFAFDCLFHNGKSLLQTPLSERRELLMSSLLEKPGQLALATTKISNDVEELEAFLNEAVDAATEGLIVKTLQDTYEPSKRSSHWLKLKKDYLAGVGDTFDVVPVGAFYGRGKRAGVFGAYLLAVYDPDSETYQTISKLGTGFSEEQLVQLADSLRPSLIPQPRPYYKYGESGAPDVWFDPVAVWEVKAADLSISPLHMAAVGLVESDKGISIRFPRLMRVRDDKSPEDATTAQQVAEMYRAQAVVQRERDQEGDADAADD